MMCFCHTFLLLFYLCLAQSQLAAQGVCAAPAKTEPYRLQAGDSLSVFYRMTPEYNETVNVVSDGTVTLQLFGPVTVVGLTLAEARFQIMKVAVTRLKAPELWLEIKEYEKPHFTVLGEVEKPGLYEIRGPLTVQEGLGLAGGFKISARHTNILLISRINNEIGETRLIDFRALQKPKQGMKLCPLHAGDMIIVPMSKLSKVERYVRIVNTGVYYNPTP